MSYLYAVDTGMYYHYKLGPLLAEICRRPAEQSVVTKNLISFSENLENYHVIVNRACYFEKLHSEVHVEDWQVLFFG